MAKKKRPKSVKLMSTHSYDLEAAQTEAARQHLPPTDQDDIPDDDLMYDLQAAASRGFYTPKWADES